MKIRQVNKAKASTNSKFSEIFWHWGTYPPLFAKLVLNYLSRLMRKSFLGGSSVYNKLWKFHVFIAVFLDTTWEVKIKELKVRLVLQSSKKGDQNEELSVLKAKFLIKKSCAANQFEKFWFDSLYFTYMHQTTWQCKWSFFTFWPYFLVTS